MAHLSLTLLGQMEIALDGSPIGAFEYNKVRALLVYLALEAARAHSRSSLAALLWPDMPERAARQNLSQALTTLRRALGDLPARHDHTFLFSTSDSVQLNPSATVQVDARRFLAALDVCEAHAHRSWHTCETCFERLRQAMHLYRGDFLAQFFLHDSQPFEEWALLQREHLRQRALRALERLAQAAEWRGTYAQAAEYAQRQLELEPLLEASHRERMRLLALNGESTAALAQYEQLRRTLAQEVDAAPEAETTTLRDRIRASAGDTRDAFRRFQPPPSHLPSVTTPLIGRAPAVLGLCERLRAGAGRALTLTGPPGIGKTRLANEAAQQLRFNFEDGVHWVELAPLGDAALVPAAIAQVVAVKERAGQRLEATLAQYFQSKHALLVLDNFEQVLDAAAVVAELLAACPALQIMVTSRAPLRIRPEQQFPLSPLSLPATSDDLEAIETAPAVQLFVERARAMQPGFTLNAQNAATVAEICARLDGLPLALELIAARVETFSPGEILRQLEHRLTALVEGPRDLPKRQQTLRGAIQWSFDLLSAEAQSVFCRLGVFAGGFTLETVSSSPSPLSDRPTGEGRLPTERALMQLVDSNLLQQQRVGEETRFMLLETIREFALEQLTARGEAAGARRRHAQFFLSLAERAQPELDGPQQAQWLDRLEREHDNLRAALQVDLEPGVESGLRLAVALGKFWAVRGYLGEGRRWLAQTLDRHPDASLSLRGQALDHAGGLAYRQGEYAAARAFNELSLAIWRRLEDPQGIARTLRRLGTIAWDLADAPLARSYYEQSLSLAREIGDASSIAGALNNLGLVAAEEGDDAAARAFYEESLVLARKSNDSMGVGMALNNLGLTAWHQCDFAAAHALLEQSLAAFGGIGHKWGSALALQSLGSVELSQAAVTAAECHYQESLALFQELGDGASYSYPLFGLGDVAYRQGDYGSARTHFRNSLTLRYESGEKRPIPRNLEGIAQVARAEGQYERAVRLFGAAEALRESLGARLTREYLPDYERETSALRAALRKTAFAHAWSEGRTFTLEQAVAFALEH